MKKNKITILVDFGRRKRVSIILGRLDSGRQGFLNLLRSEGSHIKWFLLSDYDFIVVAVLFSNSILSMSGICGECGNLHYGPCATE